MYFGHVGYVDFDYSYRKESFESFEFLRKLFIFETCPLTLIQIRYGKINHSSFFKIVPHQNSRKFGTIKRIALKTGTYKEGTIIWKVGINSLLITEIILKINYELVKARS